MSSYVSVTSAKVHLNRFVWLQLMNAAGTCVMHHVANNPVFFFLSFYVRALTYVAMELNLAMISIYEYNEIPVEFANSIGNLKSKHRFFQHFLKSEITVLNVLNACSYTASVFVFGLFNCDNNIGFFVNACTASNWRALSIHRALKNETTYFRIGFILHTHIL